MTFRVKLLTLAHYSILHTSQLNGYIFFVKSHRMTYQFSTIDCHVLLIVVCINTERLFRLPFPPSMMFTTFLCGNVGPRNIAMFVMCLSGPRQSWQCDKKCLWLQIRLNRVILSSVHCEKEITFMRTVDFGAKWRFSHYFFDGKDFLDLNRLKFKFSL